MSIRMRIARLPSWAFIILCLVASTLGFFVFGVVAAAISESVIVVSALAGIIVPIVVLVSIRRRQLRNLNKTKPLGVMEHREEATIAENRNVSALVNAHGARSPP